MAGYEVIDTLVVQVSADTQAAVKSLQLLNKTLQELSGPLGHVERRMRALAQSMGVVAKSSQRLVDGITKASISGGPTAPTQAAELQRGVSSAIQTTERLKGALGNLGATFGSFPASFSARVGEVVNGFHQIRQAAEGHAASALRRVKAELLNLPGPAGRVAAALVSAFERARGGVERFKRSIAESQVVASTIGRLQGALGDLGANFSRIGSGTLGLFGRLAGGVQNFARSLGAISRGAVGLEDVLTTTLRLPPPVAKATTSFGKFFGVLLSGFPILHRLLGKTAEHTKRASFGIKGSFIQIRSWMFFTFFALRGLKQLSDTFLSSAMSMIERINLFSVAFGELRHEANEYADAITSKLGLDPQHFREVYSTFFLMAKSLGMTNEVAQTVSQNFTQLSYDYASLRDMDFEEVATKFRSALSGQTRAIAGLGIDITLSSLRVEALREGIEGNVASFSKANKVILMHNQILRSSTKAQGDLARTISSPSNMLRVMKDQFAITARSIGFLFIPMVRALLPWLIALAQIINQAAQRVMQAFGIKMPSWRELGEGITQVAVGSDDVFENMSGVADSAGRAAERVKKLKDYTLGIDELNILAPEEPSVGGGGGGVGAALGGPLIKPFDVYDMLGGFEGLDKAIAPYRQKLEKFLDLFRPIGKSIGGFLLGIFQSEQFQRFAKATRDFFEATIGYISPHIETLFGHLKRFITTGVLPALTGFFNTLTGTLRWLKENPKAGEIVWRILEALGALPISALRTYYDAKDQLAQLVDELKTRLQPTLERLEPVWNKVKDTVSEVWDTIKTKTEAVFNWLVGYFATLWGTIKAVVVVPLALIWLAIKQTWEWIRTKTKEVWDAVWGHIKGPLQKVLDFIKPAFEKIRDVVRNVWNKLSDGLEAAWNTIRNIFKGGVNFIIDLINKGPVKLINTLISAAQKIPGIGKAVMSLKPVPEIPRLARGGVLDAGQLFVAGEAGAELVGRYQNRTAVMPLEDSGFVEAMGKAVYSAMMAAMAQQESSAGVVYLDGRKVGEIIHQGLRRSGLTASLVKGGV